MSYELPKYLSQFDLQNAPRKYKWDSDIAEDLYEVENEKLNAAINKTHFKGTLALSIAAAEWIVARFKNVTDIHDELLTLEAVWAASIDARYAHGFSRLNKEFDPKIGPFSLGNDLLIDTYESYTSLSARIGDRVIPLITVAKHVAPIKKQFEGWLSMMLARLAEYFPMDLSHYDRTTKTYDASYEKPVPRELFDPSATVTGKNSAGLVEQFICTLDPKQNHYLADAETMKRKGFIGEPYPGS